MLQLFFVPFYLFVNFKNFKFLKIYYSSKIKFNKTLEKFQKIKKIPEGDTYLDFFSKLFYESNLGSFYYVFSFFNIY